MSGSFEIQGLDGLQSKLRSLAQNPERLGQALRQEAEQVMTASKQHCPVATGALRDSGHVSEPKADGTMISVELSYGGPAAPYALFVHEGHRLVAWGHDTGRMAPPSKFLEGPLMDAVPGIERRLGTSVKAILEQVG